MEDIKISQPDFGKRLRARRLELGMSQKALAGDVMTPSYISLLENGSRVPTLDVVIRLSRLLNTTVPDLLGHEIDGLISRPPDPDRSELLAQLEVRRLTELGDYEGARALLNTKLDVLRKRNNDEQLLEFGIELLGVLTATGAHVERLTLLDELLGLPLVQRSPALYLSLSVDRTSTLRELGRLRDARRAAQESVRLLDDPRLWETPERVRLLGVLASVLCELGEFEETESIVTEMVAAAAKDGHLNVIGRAHWVASMTYARMNRPDDAFTHLSEARKALAYESMPVRDWLRFCRFNASVLMDIGHDLTAADRWIEAAEVTARMTGLASERNAAMRERARYELAVGNADAAARMYAGLVNETVADSEHITALFGLGDALERLGRAEEAIGWLRKAAEHCEENGNYRQAAEAWRHIDRLRQQQDAAAALAPAPAPAPAKDAARAKDAVPARAKDAVPARARRRSGNQAS